MAAKNKAASPSKNGSPKKAKKPSKPGATSVWKSLIVGHDRVSPASLIPNPANFRTHGEAQKSALRGSIDELGFIRSVTVNRRTGHLLDGHARVEEALVAGQDLIDVEYVDLTEAEEKKALAYLDPISAMATEDAGKLDALLRELQTDDQALTQMLTDLANEAGCEWGKEQTEIVEDEVPDPPAVPITKPGDLWLLGEHRLLCGDSRKVEDVDRLMQGDRAVIVFTDPPYGVSIAEKNRTLNSVIPGRGGPHRRNLTDVIDDALTPEQLEAELLTAFINCRTHVMAEDCTLFVCSPQGCGLSMMMMMMMMQNAGLKARHVLIWKKNQPTFSMGRLDYDYQHEPIILTWLKRHKRPMKGWHRTSVWDIDKPRKSAEHPTMKPVELYANAYLNNSDSGDVVADLYGGSGTAVVAAEQVGRKARVIELSPAYIDVCITRWQNMTGQTARLSAKIAS